MPRKPRKHHKSRKARRTKEMVKLEREVQATETRNFGVEYEEVSAIAEERRLKRKLDSTGKLHYHTRLKDMILKGLNTNRSLVSVRLNEVALDDNCLTYLETFVSNNPCLRYLNLDHNQLSFSSIMALLTAVNTLNSVRYFSIDGQFNQVLTADEQEQLVAVVEGSKTLYRVSVNITDGALLERLNKRLSENRRRWVFFANTRFECEWLCPIEFPDLCEGCYTCQCRYPCQWLRACFLPRARSPPREPNAPSPPSEADNEEASSENVDSDTQ